MCQVIGVSHPGWLSDQFLLCISHHLGKGRVDPNKMAIPEFYDADYPARQNRGLLLHQGLQLPFSTYMSSPACL